MVQPSNYLEMGQFVSLCRNQKGRFRGERGRHDESALTRQRRQPRVWTTWATLP